MGFRCIHSTLKRTLIGYRRAAGSALCLPLLLCLAYRYPIQAVLWATLQFAYPFFVDSFPAWDCLAIGSITILCRWLFAEAVRFLRQLRSGPAGSSTLRLPVNMPSCKPKRHCNNADDPGLQDVKYNDFQQCAEPHSNQIENYTSVKSA